MDICSYVAWFGLFSILGWVYECTYCAIRTKRWDNRGFLFGPVCPIYGFGVSAVLIVAQAIASTGVTSANVAWWQVFLCASAGSAVLEYTTSYVLEKCFHARWWDYSNVPLNLNGRICLPFALCFGAVGTLLYYFVCPLLGGAAVSLPLTAWEVLALLTVGLMSADLALTLSALTDVTQRVERSRADFDAVMETAVDDLASGRRPLGADLEAAAHRTAEEMSLVQRRALKSIRSYTSEHREEGAARLRRAVARVESERRARKHTGGRTSSAGDVDATDARDGR